MKIVQSFWTNSDNLNPSTAGYPDLKFLLMSWSLSCIQLKKFYPNVELVTDNFGKELLIDRLKLPYDVVHLNFEEFKTDFPTIWTVKKLYAYTLFNAPFLHVDGDVFIWKPFPPSLLENELVAQNQDLNLSFYSDSLSEIKANLKYIPSYLNVNTEIIVAANAGIIGGNNYQFFHLLHNEVVRFLDENKIALAKVNARNLSTLLEQYFYNLLAHEADIKISYLFSDLISETNYLNFARFTDLPVTCSYIHLMEGKSNYSLCEQMAQRLLVENRDLYQNVINVIEDLKIKMERIRKGNQGAFTSGNEDSSFLYSYSRSLKMLNCAGVHSRDIRNVLQLKNCITRVDNGFRAKEVLDDVFFYEDAKQEFSEFIEFSEGVFLRYKRDSLSLNIFLKNCDLAHARICFTGEARFIESKWNWCERNEFAHNIPDYSTNLRSDSFYYKTVLFLYHNPVVIREYVLDPLTIIMFDFIENTDGGGVIVEDLANLVMHTLRENNILIDEPVIIRSVLEKTKFFLYQHTLALMP